MFKCVKNKNLINFEEICTKTIKKLQLKNKVAKKN